MMATIPSRNRTRARKWTAAQRASLPKIGSSYEAAELGDDWGTPGAIRFRRADLKPNSEHHQGQFVNYGGKAHRVTSLEGLGGIMYRHENNPSLGTAGVDSGTLLVIDPAYVLSDSDWQKTIAGKPPAALRDGVLVDVGNDGGYDVQSDSRGRITINTDQANAFKAMHDPSPLQFGAAVVIGGLIAYGLWEKRSG